MSDRALLVGLGNPGVEFRHTRHNVGFDLLDHAGECWGSSAWKSVPQVVGWIAHARCNDRDVVLLKPKTFMNGSGSAVKRCQVSYQVAVENILIVCDDVTLPLGRLRLRLRGSDAGHRGLQSISAELATEGYSRLRCGIGRPALPEVPLRDYVLDHFSAAEAMVRKQMIARALPAIALWLEKDVQAAMQATHTNGVDGEEGKHLRRDVHSQRCP